MKTSTKLWYTIKPLLNFSIGRSVVFSDWRLAVLNYLLILVVLAYTIWNIVLQQQYLDFVVPTFSTSFWTQSYYSGENQAFDNSSFISYQNEFYAAQSAEGFNTTYKYCNNPDYNVDVPPDFTFRAVDCAYYDAEQMSVKSSNQITVMTTTNSIYVSFFPEEDPSVCTKAEFASRALDCPNYSTISHRIGRCYCKADNTHFAVGAENITVTIEHNFRSEYQSGDLPQTYLRRSGDEKTNYEIFDKNQQISLPVWRWLEIAGVDLDTRNENVVPGNWQGDDSVYPYLRITGVALEVQFLYYNYKKSPGKKDGKRVTCTMYVKAYPVWASTGNNIDFEETPKGLIYQQSEGSYTNEVQFGVAFKFSGGGAIYRFNLSALITALTQTTVLMGVVVLIVSQVAFNFIGEESKAYKEMAQTTFNFKREYARFAAQAIVAQKAFKEMDVTGDGYIHRSEIKSSLDSVFLSSGSTDITDDDLKVLTEFVVKETDDSIDKLRGIGDGRITQEEWVDIVTGDTTCTPSLMRIIRNMKQEDRQVLIDRFSGAHADKEEANFQAAQKDKVESHAVADSEQSDESNKV